MSSPSKIFGAESPSPVVVDGFLYFLVAIGTAFTACLNSDEAAKYLEPVTLFWLRTSIGSLHGLCRARRTEENRNTVLNQTMKTILLAIALSLTGCATQITELSETKHPDGSLTKTSVSRTKTLWDSKSELARLKTSHTDKTQSIGITGLDQESSSSNTVNLVEAVVGAAVKAAIKPAP